MMQVVAVELANERLVGENESLAAECARLRLEHEKVLVCARLVHLCGFFLWVTLWGSFWRGCVCNCVSAAMRSLLPYLRLAVLVRLCLFGRTPRCTLHAVQRF